MATNLQQTARITLVPEIRAEQAVVPKGSPAKIVVRASGMGLFRDRSIQEVVEHLGLALVRPGPRSGVAPSAIPQARQRLGVEPVQHLFELTGQAWGHASAEQDRWRGLSLYGLDGVCLRVADTAQNEAAFGRPSGRSGSGYPQVRVLPAGVRELT